MAANTYRRYIWLFDTIIQAKEITFEEISKRWQRSSLNSGSDFPHRTFQSHLRKIEAFFDVKITCQRKQNGYVYSVENLDELYQDKVRMALVNSITLNNIIKDSKEISDRIVFEQGYYRNRFLCLTVDAMKSGCELILDYRTKFDEASIVYHVAPYCLKEYKKNWYLLCFCREMNDVRHFALDSVCNMSVSSEHFELPSDFSPKQYCKKSGSVCHDGQSVFQNLRIRVYGSYVNILRDIPVHSSQNEVYTNENYSDFEFKLCIMDDLAKELLFYNSSVEVLEPQSLREMIKRQLEEISERYNK